MVSCSVVGVGQITVAPSTVKVEVDAGRTTGPYKNVWSYFGADEPNFVYATNGKTLLHELAGLSGAPVYVRLHNLLTTGDGSGSLKWGRRMRIARMRRKAGVRLDDYGQDI